MRYLFRLHLLSSLLILIAFSALLNLGFWQLNRSVQKTLTQTEYQSRHHQLISLDTLENARYDLRFYKIHLEGKFDNSHNILLDKKLDNKNINHQEGYELYTPFIIFGSDKIILVDRGFIPEGKSQNPLTEIEPIFGQQKIKGILNKIPSSGIDLEELSGELQRPFYNYILLQNRFDAPSLSIPPEKHIIYAIAWFMLAGTLCVLFIFFSIKRNTEIR
jgi:surfeit locus 1 family protein